MRAELPAVGKVSAEVFEEVIFPHLGRRRKEVLVGPQNGVDFGLVDLGHGQVMAATTDPVFVVPQYGWERSAWFAVHILASDAVTSALEPRYVTIDLNLPLSITRDELELLWTTMHRECDRIGLAVLTGHTGRYEGCGYPMVGGATVVCIGPADGYVTPAMARPGDRVIVTKGAAIEAAGLFAVSFPDRIAAAYGPEFARRAEDIFWQMSVVEDARTASAVGVRDAGVSAMHDATECGVWGALVEVALASEVGLAVDKGAIILREDVEKLCRLFEIDPYASISEGTLVITCRAARAAEVLARLHERGIPASEVGEVVERAEGTRYFEGGRPHELTHPKVDPFWRAFSRASGR
jgi:hydrogenase expression/formation protein HypE